MSLTVCGGFWARSEHETFHMKLDDGEQCWLLLHFYDPMRLMIGGREMVTEPDACIIFPPGSPLDYRGASGGFTNDYIKFFVEDEDPFRENALPLNEVFYITPSLIFTDCMSRITWALTDRLNDHARELERDLRSALSELAASRLDSSPKSRRDLMTARRLEQIRAEIKVSPVSWSVDRMADAFYMTRSHFSVLYKKHFGISPGADLRRSLIDYAAELLTDTAMSVKEVAAKCGYSSSENFIRSFRTLKGMTPLRYRKAAKEEK
ncbi:MAG: helix-turn-helix transcriptional regulator [Ruminococcus sp.]|nr:helix-turn-helix transcriptional regulator [Ruminococcus sp.]